MHDGKNGNDKVLTVPVSDPSWSGLSDLKKMPGSLAREIEHFFEVYSEIEGTGWELEGSDTSGDAKELVESCRESYRSNGSG